MDPANRLAERCVDVDGKAVHLVVGVIYEYETIANVQVLPQRL